MSGFKRKPRKYRRGKDRFKIAGLFSKDYFIDEHGSIRKKGAMRKVYKTDGIKFSELKRNKQRKIRKRLLEGRM